MRLVVDMEPIAACRSRLVDYRPHQPCPEATTLPIRFPDVLQKSSVPENERNASLNGQPSGVSTTVRRHSPIVRFCVTLGVKSLSSVPPGPVDAVQVTVQLAVAIAGYTPRPEPRAMSSKSHSGP